MRLLDFDVVHLCSDCSLIEHLKNNNAIYVNILEILSKQLLWLLELIELLNMANQTHRKIGA